MGGLLESIATSGAPGEHAAVSDLVLFTDGGCRGNPGIGAWAFVLVDRATRHALEQAGGDRDTTNNRMEIQAAIQGLSAIKKPGAHVLILSDSKYLIGCSTEWMPGWKARGWKRKGEPLKNLDLLKKLDELLSTFRVHWRWVAGHSGHHGNDHVDLLANEAMDRIELGKDPAHERRFEWKASLE